MKYIIRIKDYERDDKGNSIETIPRIENSEFGKVMTELLKLGFVFTIERMKTLSAINHRFNQWWIWNDIIVGESSDCKMIVDAGRNYSDYCFKYYDKKQEFKSGTFDELIEMIRNE